MDGNVVSWLVARFSIVPNCFQLILNPCTVWKDHYCGKKSWVTMFFWKTCLSQKKHIDICSAKNGACLPFPKESDRLLNPCERTVVPQISKALGHERVQFTLVYRSLSLPLPLSLFLFLFLFFFRFLFLLLLFLFLFLLLFLSLSLSFSLFLFLSFPFSFSFVLL